MRSSTKKTLIRLALLFGLVALGGVAMFSDLPELEESLETRLLGAAEKPALPPPQKAERHATF